LSHFPAKAQNDTVPIQEWPVPYSSSRPRDPFVAPDGKVWFVGQVSHYAATFDTGTKQFRRINLPAGAGPHNIIVDDWGRPWYTGNAATHIGRIDPVGGTVRQFPTPGANDPHTLHFGKDKSLWFTAQQSNAIGRLDTSTGAVQLLRPTGSGSLPYGIVSTPDGTIWVVLFGTNKLARIDPAARTMTEITLPRSGIRPRRVGATSDGAVWYVDYGTGYLGRYEPGSGKVEEWPCPGGANARPYAMATDDLDRIWFVETGRNPNRLVGFDFKTKQVFANQAIPSSGGTVRHMVFHRPTRTIWFGSDVNTLGRIDLSQSPLGFHRRGGAQFQADVRLSASELSVRWPHALGPKAHSTIYTLSGNKVLWAESPGTENAVALPLDNPAQGWYLLDFQAPGLRFRHAFRMAR
jgi:virginiamycin B lyase